MQLRRSWKHCTFFFFKKGTLHKLCNGPFWSHAYVSANCFTHRKLNESTSRKIGWWRQVARPAPRRSGKYGASRKILQCSAQHMNLYFLFWLILSFCFLVVSLGLDMWASDAVWGDDLGAPYVDYWHINFLHGWLGKKKLFCIIWPAYHHAWRV